MNHKTACTCALLLLTAACSPAAQDEEETPPGAQDMLTLDMSAGQDIPPTQDPCAQGVRLPAAGETFEQLSDYCFFQGPLTQHNPSPGVVPYEVRSPLYADGAGKLRFIVLPQGGTINPMDDERWEFPRGSIIIKTFFMDVGEPSTRRILETRLLTLGEDGTWTPQTYLWDEDQSQAVRHLIGAKIELQPTGSDTPFTYQVPNKNQCKNCHGQDRLLVPLGPRTRQLDGIFEGADQLDSMHALGMFESKPVTGPKLTDYTDASQPIQERALSYLEANCAHCHNPTGSGGTSGLKLWAEGARPIDYGVCRRPVAAGGASGDLSYDIAPGDPERSILLVRMKSLDPEVKMPELPLRTVDPEGVALVEEWILGMPGSCEDE